ncbi:Fusaric acid resistance protein family protein [compost metagenome]
MLTEARIGLNILQLRRSRHGLPAPSVAAIDAILDEVAAHYRAQAARRRPLPAPTGLQTRLDASLKRVQTVTAGKARDEALMGLIGLRYALFPEATVVDTPAETPAAAPGLPAPR